MVKTIETPSSLIIIDKENDTVKKIFSPYWMKEYPWLIKNEIRALSKLNSKHFPKLISHDENSLVMEYAGETITKQKGMKKNPHNKWDEREFADMPDDFESQVEEILDELEEANLRHSDINFVHFLLKDGVVKLIDFELCVEIGEALPKNYMSTMGIEAKTRNIGEEIDDRQMAKRTIKFFNDDLRNIFIAISRLPKKIQYHELPFEFKQKADRQFLKERVEMFESVYDFKDKKGIDLGCFLPDTTVLMNNYEYKEIKDIDIGDKVLTHLGNTKRVSNIFKKKYDGFLYKIKGNYGIDIEATSEHPILSVKQKEVICEKTTSKHNLKNKNTCNNSNGKCSKCNKPTWENIKPQFRKISELKENDYLILPIIDKGYKRPNKYKIILWGWYIAEGSTVYSHKPKICGLKYSLNIKEKEGANEIKNAAKQLGLNASEFIRPKKNIREINVYSKQFAEETVDLCGRGALNKKLPNDIFLWSKDSKIELLKRIFKGDGHLSKIKKNGISYNLVSISKKLIKDTQRIFIGLGCMPSFSTANHKTYKHKAHNVTLRGEDVNLLAPNTVKYKSRLIRRKSSKYIFLPIKHISKEKISNYVYNLEIEEDNSYIVNNIAVHNCNLGGVTFSLAMKGAKMIGVDNGKAFLDVANECEKYYNLGTKFIEADIVDYCLNNENHYDFCVFVATWHWIVQRDGIEKATEVLKKVSKDCDVMFFETNFGHEIGLVGSETAMSEAGITNEKELIEFIKENTEYTKVTNIGKCVGWANRPSFICTK